MKLSVVGNCISYPFHVTGFRKYQEMSACFIKVVVWNQIKIFSLALSCLNIWLSLLKTSNLKTCIAIIRSNFKVILRFRELQITFGANRLRKDWLALLFCY